MINSRRVPKGGGALLLAGAAAAFAYYKYSKLSEDQKRNLVSDLKGKGQRLYDQYVPEDIKSMFNNKGNMGTTGDEAGNYTV